MAKTEILTAEQMRQLVDYDAETGAFHWKERPALGASWNTRWAGKQIKSANKAGYLRIIIGVTHHYAHRVAWLLMTDVWPKKQIDHINGDKADNRFINLREATNSENLCNRGPQSNNKSGLKGVYFFKPTKKWRAEIAREGKRIHLGYFDTREAAAECYAEAAEKYHGEFANMA